MAFWLLVLIIWVGATCARFLAQFFLNAFASDPVWGDRSRGWLWYIKTSCKYYLLYAGYGAVLGTIFPCVSVCHWIGMIIFSSLLLVSALTDLAQGLVFTLISLLLVFFGLVCSLIGMSGISIGSSMLGCLIGYGACWAINWLWQRLYNRDGLGDGDAGVCAGIGAWLGPWGLWCVVSSASLFATLVGLVVIAGRPLRTASVPLVPFLFCGALGYLLSMYCYQGYPFSCVFA